MAVKEGRRPGQWVVEFTQHGSRVFRRLPQGITKAQAREYETKIRRELFDGTLGHKDELTLPGAIGLWLQSNRRKNQRQAVSEARQWEPFVSGRLLREAPEVAQEAVQRWASFGPANALRGQSRPERLRMDATTTKGPTRGLRSQTTRNEWPRGSGGSRLTGRLKSAPQNSAFRHIEVISRRNGPTSPATINRRLALLKAVCKHAYKQGYPENLSGRITLLKEDNKREVYLTRAQVYRLATKSPSQASRNAILVAAYVGLRASELLALTPVDMRKDTVMVRQSKTGKPRNVPVPPAARGFLSAFPLGLSYWQLHKEFSRAREAAGMPHVQFHDLRHTCASWLINAGVDLYTVGKILGHSGPGTTSRYAHLSTATLEKAMRRLK